MKATVAYLVQFRPERTPESEPVGRVPRIARLLALAHKINGMIQSGELKDLAHAAKVCGLTKARVTQIMNLTLLSPAIQEAILDLPPVTRGRDTVTERNLREIVAEPLWNQQQVLWDALTIR